MFCVVQMMYSLSVSVSNLHAMYQPVASIPLSGTVPAKVTGIAPAHLVTIIIIYLLNQHQTVMYSNAM